MRNDTAPRRRAFSALAVIGLLMVAYALFSLFTRTPRLIQYAFLPPMGEIDYDGALDEIRDGMGETDAPIALHGYLTGQSVSTADNTNLSDGVTLYMVSQGWFQTCALDMVKGEILTPYMLSQREPYILLSDKLAFRLFGDMDDLIGQKVSVNGSEYTLAGTVRHTKGYGDRDEYAAWLPLGCDESLIPELMVLSAVCGTDNGFETLLTTSATAYLGNGSLIGLYKERMRACMPLYLIALVVAVWALYRGFRLITALTVRFYNECRDRLKIVYPRQAAWYMLIRFLAVAGMIAAFAGLFWLVMWFFTRPVLVFVEWVPEELVSWGSIRTRFWELLEAAAQPVRYVTPEYAAVSFYAFLIRWGTILGLIGLVKALIKQQFENKRT